jgi:hypothetical protein
MAIETDSALASLASGLLTVADAFELTTRATRAACEALSGLRRSMFWNSLNVDKYRPWRGLWVVALLELGVTSWGILFFMACGAI